MTRGGVARKGINMQSLHRVPPIEETIERPSNFPDFDTGDRNALRHSEKNHLSRNRACSTRASGHHRPSATTSIPSHDQEALSGRWTTGEGRFLDSTAKKDSHLKVRFYYFQKAVLIVSCCVSLFHWEQHFFGNGCCTTPTTSEKQES